ncbi:MAG: hypothetical protein RLZZ511_2613 [Cyanobacteriota bacterium]|jgi:hypothetical protein
MAAITIDLPPEIVEQIRLEATRQGLEPGPFLAGFLHDRFTDTQERAIEQLSDVQVLALCDRMMTDDDQTEMSQLLEQHREGLLTEPAQQRLDALMRIYRAGMVRKAEAWKIAVERGLRAGIG